MIGFTGKRPIAILPVTSTASILVAVAVPASLKCIEVCCHLLCIGRSSDHRQPLTINWLTSPSDEQNPQLNKLKFIHVVLLHKARRNWWVASDKNLVQWIYLRRVLVWIMTQSIDCALTQSYHDIDWWEQWVSATDDCWGHLRLRSDDSMVLSDQTANNWSAYCAEWLDTNWRMICEGGMTSGTRYLEFKAN